ncbi:MAG: AAA family ATPase [Clostridiales bacterium]|nr:AAA family ATPase [Clostridiales bacterium]
MSLPKISKEDVEKALKYIDEHDVPSRNAADTYELVTDDGKKYPPKYVVAVANHLANGVSISTAGYNAIQAKDFLKKCGFSVSTKTSVMTNDERKALFREYLKDCGRLNDAAGKKPGSRSTDNYWFGLSHKSLRDRGIDAFAYDDDVAFEPLIKQIDDIDPSDRSGDRTQGAIWYSRFLAESKFKKLLEWFVLQVRINNGRASGKVTQGDGLVSKALRDRYKDYRTYVGFELDCTLRCGYQSNNSGSHFIQPTDSWLNINPIFDSDNDVTALKISYKPQNVVLREYPQKTVGELGLYDNSYPNEALRDFFKQFTDEIKLIRETAAKERAAFEDWLKENDVSGSDKTYASRLRRIEKEFGVNIDEQFEIDECESLMEKILKDPRVIESQKTGKGDWSNIPSTLRKYIEYKKSRRKKAKAADTASAPAEAPTADAAADVNREVAAALEAPGYLATNTIFYGVPGCGKSYHVNELLHIGKNFADALDGRFYKRVLFHPEYTYGDFIGQTVPQTDGSKIEYKFQAGPFVEILRDALSDADNHYFLIIEEINRGNAPGIFGDIFQLLDRDGGKSEYPVYNRDILKWLGENGAAQTEVSIPANLTIFATMNTSDQNVFTLDTAFKRRWRMTRIKNDFGRADKFLDKTVAGRAYTWRQFGSALNDDILKNCNDGMVPEDKLIGTHFVKDGELCNITAFAEKIFMYLWNDVVKYNKGALFRINEFNTLDKVIQGFVDGKNVFRDECANLKKLFDEAEAKAAEAKAATTTTAGAVASVAPTDTTAAAEAAATGGGAEGETAGENADGDGDEQ